MTTIHLPKKKRVVVASKDYLDLAREIIHPSPPPVGKKKPKRTSMTGLEGKRSKEAKRVNEREVDPEKRVERLLAIAIEHGPERLQNEIAVHERKVKDLTEALLRYHARY